MAAKETLSIVVPMYNEEKRITGSLKKIEGYSKGKDFIKEVILVNDGSTDNTINLTKKFVKRNGFWKLIDYPNNRGKGFAVRKGMLSATGDYALFFDADLSTPLGFVEKFWGQRKKAEALIGSRLLPGSIVPVRQPAYRLFLGKCFNALTSLLLFSGVPDTQCGFKLFSAKATQKIFGKQTIEGFGFDIELLFLAKKFSFSLAQFPVEWSNAGHSKVNPVIDSAGMFLDLLSIRLNDLAGKY